MGFRGGALKDVGKKEGIIQGCTERQTDVTRMEGKRRNDGRRDRVRQRLDQCCCWYLVIYSANVLAPFS